MKLTAILTAVLANLLFALPLLAQNASKAPEPKATMAQPWLAILVIALLAIVIAIPSFMSSKRGHQD